MKTKTIEELPFVGTSNQFWGAIQIYTEKAHVVNRKICGYTNLWIGCRKNINDKDIANRVVDSLNQRCLDFQVDNSHSNTECNKTREIQNFMFTESQGDEQQLQCYKSVLLQEGFKSYGNVKTNIYKEIQTNSNTNICTEQHNSPEELDSALSSKEVFDILWKELSTDEKVIYAVIRRIIPKQLTRFASRLEIVLLDRLQMSVSYIAKLASESTSVPPCVNYGFRLTSLGISLCHYQDNECDEETPTNSNITWLKNNVLTKLVKWASEIKEDGLKQDPGSLSLINVQEYNQLYQHLKIKYGQPLIEKWTENTDPQKFVYEDIAIATYLLLLWKKERESKRSTEYQSFVDLGCGNGLLVYILSGEGHRGMGIDLRKRNIWDLFPSHVELKVDVVEPSDKSLFPEYDWIIGNHSDELTPWLPVIAAKSKYTTRFFVIPCCAFDFDCKYKRKHTGISQYADYLKYVKEVGTACGFEIWEDRLKIPSTKRVCLIGQKRTYNEEALPQTLNNIDGFIRTRNEFNKRLTTGCDKLEEKTNGLWSVNFKAREAIEPVRNCTKLSEDVKEELLETVVNILLEKKCIVEVNINQSNLVLWDSGGSINLGDLAKRLNSQQLSALKKNCGGLQTFLKNHRQMFSLTEGKVHLQVPVPEWNSTAPKDKRKSKPCWFYLHHYQKCPLPASACIYAHGDDDLN